MSSPSGARLRVSIIVPTWRDPENLVRLLPVLAQLETLEETIIVDASGDVTSEQIAIANDAKFVPAERPSRGAQMNLGARTAKGDVFVFQHSDTEFSAEHLAAIATALRDPEIVGGAFYRKFDARHPRLMWLEHFARFLTRRGGTLFGDQTVFVRREIFERLSGFAEIPLMEDVEFSRRLRTAGKVTVLDPPVGTSPRRHLQRGALRCSIQNGLFLLLFKLGVSPQRLHAWYYRQHRVKSRRLLPHVAESS